MSGTTTWTELISQPQSWKRLLDRLKGGENQPELDLGAFDEIILLGSGTSYYLALAAADWIRRRRPQPVVRAVPSCEIMLDTEEATPRYGTKRLAIAFSRSGESSEGVLALKILKEAGVSTLAIGCTEQSSMLTMTDHTVFVPEGHEDGLIMLRSFTSMLIAVQYLFGTPEDRAALALLPEAGQAIIDTHGDAIAALAERMPFDRFVFLASGPGYPIAVEASLKIQEMSISTSEAYHSLEYRHGPKATADANTLITLIPITNTAHGQSLARDLKALGATLLVSGAGAGDYVQVADLAIDAPRALSQEQASALALLPMQMLAFATAIRRGNNPDAPVNLSKVVTF